MTDTRAPSVARATTDAAASQQRILAVEPSPVVRAFMAHALGRAGYGVVFVEQPALALDLLRRSDFPVDLLYVDFVLPGMDGVELIGAVRAVRPGLKAILAISHHQPDLVKRAREVGALAVVEKPMSVAILLEAVRTGLRHALPDALRVAMALYPSIGCEA